jgi:hypothetical protein
MLIKAKSIGVPNTRKLTKLGSGTKRQKLIFSPTVYKSGFFTATENLRSDLRVPHEPHPALQLFFAAAHELSLVNTQMFFLSMAQTAPSPCSLYTNLITAKK